LLHAATVLLLGLPFDSLQSMDLNQHEATVDAIAFDKCRQYLVENPGNMRKLNFVRVPAMSPASQADLFWNHTHSSTLALTKPPNLEPKK
jgi:hypothetical protein